MAAHNRRLTAIAHSLAEKSRAGNLHIFTTNQLNQPLRLAAGTLTAIFARRKKEEK